MTRMTAVEYIERFRTPKTALSAMIGIRRDELYAYLNPDRYPGVRLTDEKLQKIAAFEGRSVAAVTAEYRSKLAA